jgi:1,4-dihydroxy-2-naphthoate octaprenyltransferase
MRFFFVCLYIGANMKNIFLFIVLGVLVMCAGWLFKANDERLIMCIIGTIISFGGGGFFAIKYLIDSANE